MIEHGYAFAAKELTEEQHMINNIRNGKLPFIDDGGITLRFVKGRYLVWKPNPKLDHEILEGSLIYVGATKASPNRWNRNHERDSDKYYVKIRLDRQIQIPGESSVIDQPFWDREMDTVYFFEPIKDNSYIIEKMIYHYSEGDRIRIAYRSKKYFIDERNIEIEDNSPFWSIKGTVKINGMSQVPWVEHHHPLTDRTFAAPLLRKSVKYVCQGCGRRAPQHIVTQMKLLK